MNRRDLIKGLGALGAAGLTAKALAGVATSKEGAADASIARPPSTAVLSTLRSRPLINRAQAAKVMEQYNLAGMLAANPVNVYYLSNTVPIAIGMRKELSAFATLPRNQDEPMFLVTTTLQTWEMSNLDRWVPEVMRFTRPQNWREYAGDSPVPLTQEPVASSRTPTIDDNATLTQRERAWLEAAGARAPAPSPEWALVRAMKESGITRGRVAVDDMRIAHMLQRIGVAEGIEFVDGENLFRRIRYIKSAAEIDYLRIGGQNNYAAAMATIAGFKVGMTLAEIEQSFLAEAALRGNEVGFLLAGTSVGSFRQGKIVEGEPFLFDAVSGYQQYLGDFGRTVVVGEPNLEVKKRAAAQSAARETVMGMLRPGVRYSEIITAGREAFRKAGGPVETFFVSPHSVGLQHTDQPYRDDSPWKSGEDLALEAGMVITVDLPYIDLGFGAGHNEDLLLITADGYELLHEESDNLIVV